MSDKPASPFARLDTSLLRSTQPSPTPMSQEAQQTAGAPGARGEPESSAQHPAKQGTLEASNIGTKQTSKQASLVPINQGTKVLPGGTAAAEHTFDITQVAAHPATFNFTDDELDALDDLKRDLKRQHDIRTTKKDLIRHALHQLVENYRALGEGSWIVTRARKRS